jgi:5'-nucleotidase / UDP-sugar diphosphatase
MKHLFKAICTFILFFITFYGEAQTKEITILSVNDIHAAVDRFPQFEAVVDSVRAVHPDLLLFSAGDNRTGNPVNDKYPIVSYPIVALMNKAGFNLSAVGNHEFDSTPAGFREVMNRSNFRYVCANIYAPDTMRLHIEPYKIFVCNGVRIAVLGLLQVGSNGLPDSHPKNLQNIHFRSPYEVAKEYSWLRDRCDVFIVLSHDGYGEDLELAKSFPIADVILGGHSHTRAEGTLSNGVLVTQAEKQLKYVTELTLKVADGKVVEKKSHLINVKDNPHKDKDVQAMVNEFNDNKELKRVVAQAKESFSNKEELGCMMADAICFETGSDISLQNAGGVRLDSLTAGPITLGDIYRLDPFGNEIIMFNMTGDEVYKMILATTKADYNDPGYVSGIKYTITFGKDKSDVKDLKVWTADGSPINKKRVYKVAMNSYMASVSDFEKKNEGQNMFRTCSDAIIDYLTKQSVVDYKGAKRVTIKRMK